jgi:EpsD family peptidyl-prolyl cis-trans isomerase
MTHSARRPARSLLHVSGVALLFLTASCNKAEPKGQVIAVVNGEEITVGELNEEAKARGLSIANDARVRASVVQDLIERKLLVNKALQRQVDRSPEHLLAARRLNELLLVQELVAASTNPSDPPNSEIAAFIRTHPAAFDQRASIQVTQISFPPVSNEALKGALAGAPTLDAIQALLAQAHIAGKRSAQALDSATLPPGLAARLLSSGGKPVLVPEGDTVVAVEVTAITPRPIPPEQRVAAAKELIRQQRSGAAVQALLRDARAKAKVEYQQGFGPG